MITNEEKAEEICRDYNITQFYNDGTHDVYTESAVLYMLNEMAQWKEQQMIKYLYKNIQSLLKDYGVSEASADIATKLFLVNFKQSMKEE